jgi:hypothetical protein
MARGRGPRPALTPVPGSGAQPVLSSLDTPVPQDTPTVGQRDVREGRRRIWGTGADDGLDKALQPLGSIGR